MPDDTTREAAREAAALEAGWQFKYAPVKHTVYCEGFDAGADWQREQDQARPDTDDCMNECAQGYLKTLLKRERERIARLESDLRIERGRVEGMLNHAALAGEE